MDEERKGGRELHKTVYIDVKDVLIGIDLEAIGLDHGHQLHADVIMRSEDSPLNGPVSS